MVVDEEDGTDVLGIMPAFMVGAHVVVLIKVLLLVGSKVLSMVPYSVSSAVEKNVDSEVGAEVAVGCCGSIASTTLLALPLL